MTMFYFFLPLFFLLCVTLSFVILMQESKSLGLGDSFGGDPGTSLFGTSTPYVLKQITRWLIIIFFFFCLGLSFWTRNVSEREEVLLKKTVIEEF